MTEAPGSYSPIAAAPARPYETHSKLRGLMRIRLPPVKNIPSAAQRASLTAPHAAKGTAMTRRTIIPVFVGSATLGGCADHGAPSIVLFGSFFPAWMLCGLIGIFGAIAARGVFVAAGLNSVIPFQLFVCSSLGVVVAALTWRVWFGH